MLGFGRASAGTLLLVLGFSTIGRCFVRSSTLDFVERFEGFVMRQGRGGEVNESVFYL